MGMEIEGAAPGKPTILLDVRDSTALSQGADNAASEAWRVLGEVQPAVTPFYSPTGAAVPVLTLFALLGMRTYRLLSNNNAGGFFNNRFGLPLSRQYNNGGLVLRPGAFGPLLRWRFRATLWTETPQPLATIFFNLLSGNSDLGNSVNTTGYELRSVNGAAWEIRRRLVTGGVIDVIPIPSSVNSLTPQTWEWIYSEGATPRLELRRDDTLVATFLGQALMPALNGAVVFPAHMPRWSVINTGVVNAVHHLLGGHYQIATQ